MIIPLVRTARERDDNNKLSEPTPLEKFKDLQAWVLIGDPGSGKTTALAALAAKEGGERVSARDFLDLSPPKGYRYPIFIDGLDEYTAGTGEAMTAIGRIRNKLQALGTPAFRLSCREADWRGTTDSNALQQLVQDGQFAELHLEPLDHEQVLLFTVHWQKSSPAAAKAFVDEAQRRSLDGLLANPQTLRMLIKAVSASGSDWPRSKAETFGIACNALVREQNEEHLAAQRDTSLTGEQLIQAASFLCAVMLLSGSAGIARGKAKHLQAYFVDLAALKVNDLKAPSLPACRAALHTHIFMGDGTGKFTPIHRTVAEYLAAMYLAERIRARLPANRVLALMQADDGGVVPELRGLQAWLAVVATEGVRRQLIDQDPLGLILHGDVRDFSPAEKERLLNALQQEATRYTYFRNQNWTSHPFGALATDGMQARFKVWLQSPARAPAHQAVLDCVLDAMEHGDQMPELAPELEKIVGDKTCWSGLRRSALRLLCRNAHSSDNWEVPERILQAIQQGALEDADSNLMGELLHRLYPQRIAAANLWQYYRPGPLPTIGQSWEFWRHLATRYAPPEHLQILLDALVETNIRLKSTSNDYDLAATIGDLLSESLAHFGNRVEVGRLYTWLTLGVGEYRDNNLEREKQGQIGHWLENQPALYKRLVEYGITQLERTKEPPHLWLYEMSSLLCEAQPPADAAQWYLSLAASRTDSFRQQLIREAFGLTQHRESADVALRLIASWTEQHPEDADWISQDLLSSPYPPQPDQIGWHTREVARQRKDTEKKVEEIQFLRKALPDLTTDKAHLGLLVEVGQAYLGRSHNLNAKTPNERLLKILNDDPHWVDMALAGLRHCLARTDLPSATDIIALYLKGRRYTLATPCLAAMELLFDEQPSKALDGAVRLLETLVAFGLTNNFGETPPWFLRLVQLKPEIVGPVMQMLLVQQIAAKSENIDWLYALAHDANYSDIAKRIAPELIAALPTKTRKTQLKDVRQLISCMLRTLDKPVQRDLLEHKLAVPNMDVAQRVYWLVAGVQVEPATYLDALKQYLGTNQSRASHAYELLHEQRQEKDGVDRLNLEAKAYFVELLGERFAPSDRDGLGKAYWVSNEMVAERFVGQLIHSIAADPSDSAHQSLAALMNIAGLKLWGNALQQASYEQQIVRRKAHFKHASVSTVCQTLANLQPANPADLHALVVDHLKLLAAEIRDGNTDDYTQYWRGSVPEIENVCRNRLLSDLKRQLEPLGISAEPEGNYAEQKRADIKVIFGALQMPVEVKLESSKDLWTAIQDQLIAKYSRERSSDCYSIFVVFWFKGAMTSTAADGGNKPKTPCELQRRLAATVPIELKHKVTVLVVDCSKRSE